MLQAEIDFGQVATGPTLFSPMNLLSGENSVIAAPDATTSIQHPPNISVSSVGALVPSASYSNLTNSAKNQDWSLDTASRVVGI